MNTKTKPRVILLFGPTGVGKTDLLEALFTGKGEVISADSMQVYRQMDIGTAKPPQTLLRSLPHHLVDILEPSQQFHTGEFTRRTEFLISEITSRGLIPVISGGTAFYYRNFLYGMPVTPAADQGIRQTLEERWKEEGLDVLHRELSECDPPSAERISPNDAYRILRALEVYLSSGRPLSDYPAPKKIRTDYELLTIGLNRDRAELYERIDHRVEIMFRTGLFDEFRRLLSAGFDREDPGMQGIGYREFFRMLREPCLSLDGVKRLIKTNSRRYAKRQLTFFRSFSPVLWFHPEAEEQALRAVVQKFLSTRN